MGEGGWRAGVEEVGGVRARIWGDRGSLAGRGVDPIERLADANSWHIFSFIIGPDKLSLAENRLTC